MKNTNAPDFFDNKNDGHKLMFGTTREGMSSQTEHRKSMQIQLKVSHHPSGRYTLMQRNQNDMGFSDVQEPALFGNDDAGLFYKAVAARLARLYAEGHGVRELLNHGKFKKHGGDMPSWLYSLITVMNPIQGMLLATLGTAGLAGSLMSKRQGLQVVGLCLFVLGGYGFANVLGGVLPIKVN